MLGMPYTLFRGIFMKENFISSGLEDYVEQIYISHINNTRLRGAELARKLNVSRASVSEALAKLSGKKLINYSSYGDITLTDSGIEIAKKVYNKHSILKEFFETVLEVKTDMASENACKIEHIISQDIVNRMSNFTKFYQKNKDLFVK